MVKSPTKLQLDIQQIENIASLKTDMIAVKSDIRALREDFKAFVNKADEHYATKKEVQDLKCEVNNNTNKIWQLSKEVAQWGTIIALITKTVGLW